MRKGQAGIAVFFEPCLYILFSLGTLSNLSFTSIWFPAEIAPAVQKEGRHHLNLIEGLRKEFKVSGHFVSILLLAVWSLVLILNMLPLQFLGTQFYFALQHR